METVRNSTNKTLENLSDDLLLVDLKNMISKERSLVVQILEYLREVETRKLHLARGYSSMFSFCTENLGYSEAEAHIRIQAMRLTKEVPEVAQNIEEGTLSLSVAAMAQNQFRKEDFKRKSKGATKLSASEKSEIILELQSCSKKEATEKLAERFALPTVTKLTFEASEELVDKIDQLKNLLAHKNFNGDLGKLIEIMADTTLKHLEKKMGLEKSRHENAARIDDCLKGSADHQSTLPDKVSARQNVVRKSMVRSRYIPSAIRQEVWFRSKGKCQYIDSKTGRQCKSGHALQIDHIYEFAKGGENNVENLRLLCAGHNQFRNFR